MAGGEKEYLEGEADLGKAGEILRREGADPIILAAFYLAVV